MGGNKKIILFLLKNNTRKPHHSRFFYAFFIVNFHPKFSEKKKMYYSHREEDNKEKRWTKHVHVWWGITLNLFVKIDRKINRWLNTKFTFISRRSVLCKYIAISCTQNDTNIFEYYRHHSPTLNRFIIIFSRISLNEMSKIHHHCVVVSSSNN